METISASWVKHPGYYIKEEMEARGWSQRDLAFILGVPEQAINPILNGKRGISPEWQRHWVRHSMFPPSFSQIFNRLTIWHRRGLPTLVCVAAHNAEYLSCSGDD